MTVISMVNVIIATYCMKPYILFTVLFTFGEDADH